MDRNRKCAPACWKIKKSLHTDWKAKMMYAEISMCRRMLVGAPWDGPPNNRKGDVYRCIVGGEKNSNCSKVNLGERNKYLNQTLTTRFGYMLACFLLHLTQVKQLSRTFPKTWGIHIWEWHSLQTHLMASWYVVFILSCGHLLDVCGSLKGCGDTRLCWSDRTVMNQLCRGCFSLTATVCDSLTCRSLENLLDLMGTFAKLHSYDDDAMALWCGMSVCSLILL